MKTPQSNRWTSILKNAAMIALVSFVATACSKDESPETDNNQQNSAIQMGDGTLVAVRSETVQSTPIGDMTINVGTAVAAFNGGNNYGSLVDAGTVTVDGESLQKYDNNSYVFTPGLTNPTGIEFGNDVQWSVSGNGSVPSFEHTMTGGFPNVGNITSGDEVSKSAGYTLTIASVSNADSIYFMVNEVYKSLPGNAKTYTFSADELSSLGTGQAIVSIAAWRFSTAAYSGKNFYFVNETVKQKTVNITN